MDKKEIAIEEKNLDRVLGVKPANLRELLSSGIVRETEGTDFRDVSVVVLRHADEQEGKDAQTLGISNIGDIQIKSSVDEIATALGRVEGDIVIKFYSSPNKWAKATAEGMIEGIESKIESASWPRNIRLLSTPGSRQKPREKEQVTRDVHVALMDVKRILAEREERRKLGENVEFSTILIEMDRLGELQPETEGKESVAGRLIKTVKDFQKINEERIPPKGEKIIFIIVIHNIYFEALVGRKAEGCCGVRIDLPLRGGDRPIIVGANGNEELDW